MKPNPHEIAVRREELFRAEQAFDNQCSLLSKRENLEKKINKLKTEIHQKKIGLHESFEQTQLEKILVELRVELRHLDHRLDEWDDITEKDLDNMRENMFSTIWESYPNQYENQKQNWEIYKNTLILVAEIQNILEIGNHLQEILNTIIQTRSKIKGKGLLSYIFGISPNAIIERHLFYVGDYIREKLTTLEHSLHETEKTPLHLLFKRFFDIALELKNHSGKVWGFRHIDTSIAKSNKELKEICEIMEEQKLELYKEKEERKKMLDEWIISM